MMTLLPSERAGPSFHPTICRGKFQGSTQATTPAGSRTISPRLRLPEGEVLPYCLSLNSACHSRQSMVSGRSVHRFSRMGLPLSILSSTASSTMCFSIRPQSLRNIFLRSVGCILDHTPESKVLRATDTALSTSSLPQLATWASSLPVAGLMVAKVLPEAAGINLPSIKAMVGYFRLAARFSYSWQVRN